MQQQHQKTQLDEIIEVYWQKKRNIENNCMLVGGCVQYIKYQHDDAVSVNWM